MSTGPVRLIGLDIGDKRVGFAFATDLGIGSSMVVPGGFLAVQSMERSPEIIKELIDE